MICGDEMNGMSVAAERETRKHGVWSARRDDEYSSPAVGSWWFEFDTVQVEVSDMEVVGQAPRVPRIKEKRARPFGGHRPKVYPLQAFSIFLCESLRNKNSLLQTPAAKFKDPSTTSHARSNTSHNSGSDTPSATTFLQTPDTTPATPISACKSPLAELLRPADSWWSFPPEARVCWTQACGAAATEERKEGGSDDLGKSWERSVEASCV